LLPFEGSGTGIRGQKKRPIKPSVLDLVQNPKNHFANFVRQTFCFIKQLLVAFSKRTCDFELGLQFKIRTSGYTKKLPILFGAQPSVALGDIARY